MNTLPTEQVNFSEPVKCISEIEEKAVKFITPCGDGSIVWRCWGSGPPVLLAHGSHGSWMHWIKNIETLAKNRSVWTVDLPGWGDSAKPPGTDQKAIADVLAIGINELFPNKQPLDLVGFSFGGVVLAHFAGFYPTLARRLILVDTGGLSTPVGDIKLQGVRNLSNDERLMANRHNLLALMIKQPDQVDELALHIQAEGAKKARLNPIPYVFPEKLQNALTKISCQVDAIWGEFDQPHPNPELQEEAIKRSHPDMTFQVIKEAGHWVMYERPESFNRTLMTLLDTGLRKRGHQAPSQ